MIRNDDPSKMQFSVVYASAPHRWGGIEASISDISAGIAEPPAMLSHSLSLHLSAPVEGTCRCDGSTVRRIIQPGDIDFVPLGSSARWHDMGSGRIANFRLSASLMSASAAAMGRSSAEALCFAAQLSLKDPVLRYLTLSLVAELESGADNGPLFGESVGHAIAAHLLKTYARVQRRALSARLSQKQISRIVEYIQANLAADLSLSAIASEAGLSISHLKVLFKEHFGSPVHQYVIQQRVENAVRLLIRTEARLCDVAQQSGFTDQSHMARCMRRVIGTTPAALLRETRSRTFPTNSRSTMPPSLRRLPSTG